MGKLDFSGISTGDLERASKMYAGLCAHLQCYNCPLNVDKGSCNEPIGKVQELFKEELNRREKDMNEMPELRASQIILDKSGNYRMVMLLNKNNNIYGGDFTLIDRKGYTVNLIVNDVEKVYQVDSPSYAWYFNANGKVTEYCELIWSRKSDKDIKIEELQKKMDAISKEMEELKG